MQLNIIRACKRVLGVPSTRAFQDLLPGTLGFWQISSPYPNQWKLSNYTQHITIWHPHLQNTNASPESFDVVFSGKSKRLKKQPQYSDLFPLSHFSVKVKKTQFLVVPCPQNTTARVMLIQRQARVPYPHPRNLADPLTLFEPGWAHFAPHCQTPPDSKSYLHLCSMF